MKADANPDTRPQSQRHSPQTTGQNGRFRRGDARNHGRPKGVPNKLTTALREMILLALSNVGGIAYLEAQALKNPNAFLTLIGRVLPLQVNEGGSDPLVPRPVIHVHERVDSATTQRTVPQEITRSVQ